MQRTPNYNYDNNGFIVNPEDYPCLSSEYYYNESKDVGFGAWVIILRKVPVQKPPVLYGIYWAVPYKHRRECGVEQDKKERELIGVDENGRQCCLIYAPHQIKVFPQEISILSEERLQEYRDNGWELHETNADVTIPLNRSLLEQGRTLCEEEREIIMSLMLDGLTEQQACEEYFFTHHTDYDNTSICYLLPKDKQPETEIF